MEKRKDKKFTLYMSEAASKWLAEEALRRRLTKNAVLTVLINREMEGKAK